MKGTGMRCEPYSQGKEETGDNRKRALALPPEARAGLWLEEIRKRQAEVGAGAVPTIPWPEVYARLRGLIRKGAGAPAAATHAGRRPERNEGEG